MVAGGGVMVWWLASAGAALALLTNWRGPNAVWGGATFGALFGVVLAVLRPGFDWSSAGKAVVIGTLAGLAFEWLLKIARSKAAAPAPPLGTGQHSYLRVRWLDLPPTDPIETW